MGGSSSKSKSKSPPPQQQQHLPRNSYQRHSRQAGGSGKSAWENGNGVHNNNHHRNKPVQNGIRKTTDETDDFAQTTYNMFDIQNDHENDININNREKFHSYEGAGNSKYSNFQNLTKDRDRRMAQEAAQQNKASSAPLEKTSNRRRRTPTPPSYRRRRSPSPPSPKKSPQRSPKKSPQKFNKKRSSPKKATNLDERPPWDSGSPGRRHSDVSTIDMSSPEHFRQPPARNNNNRFSNSNGYTKKPRTPPGRRARSSSPLRKKSPPFKVQPAPYNKNRSGPSKTVARRSVGGKGFTNIASVKSASQSMDSNVSNLSNFEYRSKVETFNDKRESLDSAGLTTLKALNNTILDQKILGQQSYDEAKRMMDTDDWNKEIKGIEMIVSLARDRPEVSEKSFRYFAAHSNFPPVLSIINVVVYF